jgi:hypothetical protein
MANYCRAVIKSLRGTLINYCMEGAALLNLTLYSKAGQNINQNIYTVFVNSTLAVVGCWRVV